ncbi:hypothetical protein JTE90_002423 [Oedothorax gibbosus]|uniref:Cytochrome P450 n=1 Tax=Oedothorax gibbosus TaxID=931172 RepID=A0AAV6UVK5_9ARAC|nr:hypothetical protein JTE90_002423 [Oedothorax gibbosus]
MSKFSFLTFQELNQKYGEVFSLNLGGQTLVVLNGTDSIKEAFSKPEFVGKPSNNVFDILARKSPFFNSGVDVWSEHRRFVLHSMRDLGLGHTKIESHIQDEINHFIDTLRDYKGQPVDCSAPLRPSMANNMAALVFGERYEYEDNELKTLVRNYEETTRVIGRNSYKSFFPWMRHVPYFSKLKDIEKGKMAAEETKNIFRKKLMQHEETLDPNNIRDYMDAYLVEMKSRKEKNTNTSLSESMLINSVVDLYQAGSDTVVTAVLWSVYTAAAYQDVQRRVQREIADIGGRPQFADWQRMPYTRAVLMEIMRWKTVAPLSVKCTVEDTTVGGYNIPKGTTVLGNRWAVHMNPKHWEDPDSFIPERFLTKDGLSTQKSAHYMPFSVGKRLCPGESMAYMEVFLYFVAILQNFNISFPEGVKPTYDAYLAVTYCPKPFKLCFTSRN